MRSLPAIVAVVLVLTSVATPVLGLPPGPRIEPFNGSPTNSDESNQTSSPTTTTPTTNPETDTNSPEKTTDADNPFATAEPAAFDGTCSGLGPFSGNICNGVLAAVNDLARGFLEFSRDIAEWAVEFLVSRPVPVQDGTPEFIDRPTNAPMDTVYDLWFTLGLPAGLGLWALFMLFFRAEALLPGHVVTARQAKVLELKGWLALFGILGSWIWCAFLLYLSSGLADWFAPAGAEIATSFERILSGAVAAGLGAILLWLSTGVLFVFVALMFGLSWLAVYVLIPAMPILIALSLPAVWIFRPIASIGQRLRELFVPAAFVPFPAAVILGVGYPVINAIHSSLDFETVFHHRPSVEGHVRRLLRTPVQGVGLTRWTGHRLVGRIVAALAGLLAERRLLVRWKAKGSRRAGLLEHLSRHSRSGAAKRLVHLRARGLPLEDERRARTRRRFPTTCHSSRFALGMTWTSDDTTRGTSIHRESSSQSVKAPQIRDGCLTKVDSTELVRDARTKQSFCIRLMNPRPSTHAISLQRAITEPLGMLNDTEIAFIPSKEPEEGNEGERPSAS